MGEIDVGGKEDRGFGGDESYEESTLNIMLIFMFQSTLIIFRLIYILYTFIFIFIFRGVAGGG